MEQAALRYARNVLIAHLLALVLVIAIVLAAARGIYTNTRRSAEAQATHRQELLASQTARAIENHYAGILEQLDLLRVTEEGAHPTDLLDQPQPALQALFLAPVLWRQIEGRASHLFAVDLDERLTIISSFSSTESITAGHIATSMAPWLHTVRSASISPFQIIDGLGMNLAAVPVAGPGRRLLVAVVPVRQIEAEFLNDVNKEQQMGATLLDSTTAMMATSERSLVGKRVTQHLEDAALRSLVEQVTQSGESRSSTVDRTLTVAGVKLEPRLVTAEPIRLPGQTWYLFIDSHMSEVQAVVSKVFRSAMWWAVFVVISMTGILVSTAVQMIRGRVRLERIRNDLLHRELGQAREIQLHWLPNSTESMRSLDIAALNQPASHISGDFYNWFELPDGRTVVTIGDVTGHGMAAAFLMATTQLLVRTTMPRVLDPGTCLEEVNRQLCFQVFNGQFVTMLIMVIDVESGAVEIATAGHPPPLVGDGESFQPLPIEPQLVLGIDRDVRYPTERLPLAPRSSLILYTDGVLDAQAASGERFDVDGLKRCLYGRFDSAQLMLDVVLDAVNAFRGTRDLSDDVTIVTMQVRAAAESPDEPQPVAATA